MNIWKWLCLQRKHELMSYNASKTYNQEIKSYHLFNGYTDVSMNNGNEWIKHRIKLVRTKPSFGGTKIWFQCPGCKRRIANLYLPNFTKTIGCRKCLGLSYESKNGSKRKWRWKQIIQLEQELTNLNLKPERRTKIEAKIIHLKYLEQRDWQIKANKAMLRLADFH